MKKDVLLNRSMTVTQLNLQQLN